MTKPTNLTPLEAVNKVRTNHNGQVVLVLQGGGALGAYQGGVYQALHEAGVEPDWIIGTSIGAINAAIIAGNKPENRLAKLRDFWKRVERADYWGSFPAWAGVGDALASWMTLTSGISGFFEPQPGPFSDRTSISDLTMPAIIRPHPCAPPSKRWWTSRFSIQRQPRLTVGAAHVRTSMMHYFDSREMELTPSHIMASGALPPAFPAVRDRRRALLGRRHPVQHARRAHLRGQPAPQLADLRRTSLAPDRGGAGDASGRSCTALRTSNTRAGSPTTSCGRAKPIGCAM